MNVSQAVVTRILELCKEKKITINALCTLSGITQSTVNDIVNGVTHNPGIATIKKICDGLDMGISDFFGSPLFDGLDQEIK